MIHIAHNFLDCHDNVLLPGTIQRPKGQIISATLYDLIPLIYDQHYLKDPYIRRRYLYQLQRLRRFDLLFAISESTRQDAIRLLDINPSKIVTVYGGIDDSFYAPIDSQKANALLRKKYRLEEKILMYTGGDDFRKNISGAIKAFAKVKKATRDRTTFVIIGKLCEESKSAYLKTAKECNLNSSNILFTGFVDHDILIAFYQACDGFIFPSMYEGLGLPILEAMQCGAPVIGSNNSSLKELLNRDDALFDLNHSQSMTQRIELLLENDDYANNLREFSVTRARDFSWRKTTEKVLNSLQNTLEKNTETGTSIALKGHLDRKRIAMLTPLPPAQSGIADYSSDFLPYLSAHFDIDLFVDERYCSDERISATFRVYSIESFPSVATNYEAILYEIGNSDFHTHMLSLLEQYPGIVTLHDAYMSGILAHLEFSVNQTGLYQKELLYSHGPLGRRFISSNTDDRERIAIAIDRLPTTKRIIDNAIGVISHSTYNVKVAEEYYPESWHAPYRVIPQLMQLPHLNSDSKQHARTALGLPRDAFVIATFGHVVWTKRGDLLLNAFLDSDLLIENNAYLVFVGKPSEDQFGKSLKRKIKKSKASKRIRITGFASVEDYNRYLQASDVGVQLRTNSRGGTPRSVLDCLANGLPVVLNDYASFKDYADNVVLKVAGEICSQELRTTLEDLFSNPTKREMFSQAGKTYIKQHHSPTKCAAEYANVIDEFVARHNSNNPSKLAKQLAPYLETEECEQFAKHVLTHSQKRIFTRNHLFIDVSHIAQTDHQTGIQRIVRDVVAALYRTEIRGIEPVAVELIDGKLVPAHRWLEKNDLLSGYEQARSTVTPISFSQGDTLLMLDSSWDNYDDFLSVFSDARENNVPIINIIYDLLPIKIPECFVEGGPQWFESWFKKSIKQCDGLLCISAATQKDVLDYLKEHEIMSPPSVNYWHHGSDFEPTTTANSSSLLPLSLVRNDFLLMVGTIEPRKLHAMALEAMELLWDNHETNLKLCIAGKQGWLVEQLMEKIRSHSRLQESLEFIEAPDDDVLQQLYANASGLLFLSKGEGLGLPIIEAAKHHTPIICSDIPAFHEVAGNHATYVEARESQELRNEILEWQNLRSTGNLPDPSLIEIKSCDQSTNELLHILLNDMNP